MKEESHPEAALQSSGEGATEIVRDQQEAATYIDAVFGESEGYAAMGVQPINGKFFEKFFKLPRQKAEFVSEAMKLAPTADVYVCPILRREPSRKTGTGTKARFVFADYDGNAEPPSELLKGGGFLVNSGRGLHAYAKLSEPTDAQTLQKLNRKLTYSTGADKGGWSETKYLRLPGTFNHKPRVTGGEPLRVNFVVSPNGGCGRSVEEFEALLPAEPSSLPPRVEQLLNEEPDDDRSKQTARLAYALFDEGVSEREVSRLLLKRHLPSIERSDKTSIAADVRRLHSAWEVKQEQSTTHEVQSCLSLVPLSSFQKRRVEWLVPGLVPRGMLTFLVGLPGRAKSTLALKWCAEQTRSGFSCIFVTVEDSIEQTVLPRAEFARADCDKLQIVKFEPGRVLSIPRDVEEFERLIQEVGASLLVLDPLSAMLGDNLDSNKDQHVRRALSPLHEMAARTNCSVLSIMHLNKAVGMTPLHRIGGSQAFGAAARSVLLLDDHPDASGKKILAHVKCNVGALAPSVELELEQGEVDGFPASRLLEIGTSSLTAESLLADAGEQSQEERAAEIIGDVLSDGGWHLKKDVEAEIDVYRISAATLKRAARGLVETRRTNTVPSRTEWRLSQSAQSAQAAPVGSCDDPISSRLMPSQSEHPESEDLGQPRGLSPVSSQSAQTHIYELTGSKSRLLGSDSESEPTKKPTWKTLNGQGEPSAPERESVAERIGDFEQRFAETKERCIETAVLGGRNFLPEAKVRKLAIEMTKRCPPGWCQPSCVLGYCRACKTFTESEAPLDP